MIETPQRAKGNKTAAKAAKDKSAPRLNVASAHKMNMRLNIDYIYTQNL